MCFFCDDLRGDFLSIPWETILCQSEAGCRGCGVLSGAVTSYCLLNTTSLPASYSSLTFYKGKSGQDVCFKISWQRSFDDSLYLELYATEESSRNWPNLPIARSVSDSASSDDCFALASQWLSDCVANHISCPSEISTLPTRTIFLGDGMDKIRLRTSRYNETGRYLILSHRWGDPIPLKTTSCTFDGRQYRISYDGLPKTFQDAVFIAQKLGVDHLWIDSLCIIQDDEHDWAKESSVMANYYAGAYLTIAANGSTSSLTGCFNQRSNDMLSVCYVLPKDPGPEFAVCIRRHFPETKDPRLLWHAFGKKSVQSTLDLRGWIFQERLLSPRILHYSTTELAWECNTCAQCECRIGPKAPESIAIERILKRRLLEKRENTLSNAFDPVQDILHWKNIIENFTMKDLTVDTDRLPALSGLAALMDSDKKKGSYLGGMWTDSIRKLLLWRIAVYKHEWRRFADGTKRSKPKFRRQKGAYAPTWSWASITGPVIFPTEEDPNLGHIYQVSGTPMTENPYGPVRDSRVTARGDLHSANEIRIPEKLHYLDRNLRGTRRRVMSSWRCLFDIPDEVCDLDDPDLYIFSSYLGPGKELVTSGLILYEVTSQKEFKLDDRDMRVFQRRGYAFMASGESAPMRGTEDWLLKEELSGLTILDTTLVETRCWFTIV